MIAVFGPKMWALHKHDESTQPKVGSLEWRQQLEQSDVTNRYDGKIGPTRSGNVIVSTQSRTSTQNRTTTQNRVRWSQSKNSDDLEQDANENA